MQAILVIAHKNIEQVTELSKLLKENLKFIFIDKKCIVPEPQMRMLLNTGAHVFQKVDVRWGGWGVAEAARVLFREALKNKDITYMHVISGEDYPVKSPEIIYNFYENNNKIYMQCDPAERDLWSLESRRCFGRSIISIMIKSTEEQHLERYIIDILF